MTKKKFKTKKLKHITYQTCKTRIFYFKNESKPKKTQEYEL
jgi:hypothetical protein